MQYNTNTGILRTTLLAAGLLAAASCSNSSKILYTSKAYTLYSDKVIQGNNEAIVHTPGHISSSYQSTASSFFSRKVNFKVSINEKDMEMAPGKDHFIIIGAEHESPVITFGKLMQHGSVTEDIYLPANYEYTFRVDMGEVIRQFDTKGYYTAYDGTKLAKADFKGFYIAGDARPLTWDFSNLEENNLKLQDPDGDNIYELKVLLNPVATGAKAVKDWKLSWDISGKPTYTSEQPIVDALFKMSTEEALINIEPDRTFRTGAKWSGVWTRDISYSILLAFAYHQPDVAKISLMKKVKRGRIIQDTGSGGAWPVSSDRATWALAAWEIYKVTGDTDWLESSYAIIKNTLDDDYKTLYDTKTGLYRGESSFLDWREQTYPKWMDNRDIYASENLGTNAVHYKTHTILAAMGRILGKDVSVYESRAEKLKAVINSYLWQEDKGYYAQYLYGREYLSSSPRFEALGEALAILFEIADKNKVSRIIAESPVTEFGATCIYPQIPGIPPYHNNAVWPFVQSYFNLAAAKAGNETVLNFGLAAIYRPAALFLTNYENFVASNGDYAGTEINSDHMLWSMAGNLAMVYRVFMGMEFTEEGILFRPAVPKQYDGVKRLERFKYRNADLTITVNGYGNRISGFKLDGKAQDNYSVPNTISGCHTIEIEMQNNDFSGGINLTHNHFSPANPQASRDGDTLKWGAVTDAVSYTVYKNGSAIGTSTRTDYPILNDAFAEYKVSATDAKGYESFTSEPILVYPANSERKVQIEDATGKSAKPYINFEGTGFSELSKTSNREVTLKVTVAAAGNYHVDFRYSNGNGPWNTDNKCAIRSLYANGDYQGVLVMPQRGAGEWSDWAYTNSYAIPLHAGENTIKIVFEEWNNNMNVDENTAMVDFMRIIKMN
ncbi:MAG: MGH1-like glycoside hydrolase domain-containing protein [Bacteroidia bacterium]